MALTLTKMKVRLTFVDDILGTLPADKNLRYTYVEKKAPDAKTMEEEIYEDGVDAVVDKGITMFRHDEDGNPYLKAYQIRGFFKGAGKALNKVPGTKTKALKAYRQEISTRIFIDENVIPIHVSDQEPEDGCDICQRPLRADTPQGERVSIAASEQLPAESTIEFTVGVLVPEDLDIVREWLDYGEYSGIGQWRNSGKGRFLWDELDMETGEVIGGNCNYHESKEAKA